MSTIAPVSGDSFVQKCAQIVVSTYPLFGKVHLDIKEIAMLVGVVICSAAAVFALFYSLFLASAFAFSAALFGYGFQQMHRYEELLSVHLNLRRTSNRLHDDVDRMEGGLIELEDTNQSLLVRSREFEQHNASLRENIEELQGRLSALSNQVDRFSTENERLEENNASFRAQCQQLGGQCQELGNRIISMQNVDATLSDKMAALSTLETQYQTTYDNFETLKQQFGAKVDTFGDQLNAQRTITEELKTVVHRMEGTPSSSPHETTTTTPTDDTVYTQTN